MPEEMVEWLKMTAKMIIDGDMYKEAGGDEYEDEAPYSCPIKKCPECPRVECPPPE